MTNLEKIKLIIGDENFKKLEKNFDSNFSSHKNLEALCNHFTFRSIEWAFNWEFSGEGYEYWEGVSELLWSKQNDFKVSLREISPEEHDLIFKMFVCEYMEWFVSESVCYEWFDEGSLAKKMYDALICVE